MIAPRGPLKTRSYGVVSGLFPDRVAAERAYVELLARGYSPDDVTLVLSEASRRRWRGVMRPGTKVLKGAGVGGVVGTAAGALAGLVLAVGSAVVIPGLGLAIAGPVAGAVAGAGAGAATGTLIGAAVGTGMSEKRIKVVATKVRKGGILLTVRARSAADAVAIEREWRLKAIELV